MRADLHTILKNRDCFDPETREDVVEEIAAMLAQRHDDNDTFWRASHLPPIHDPAICSECRRRAHA